MNMGMGLDALQRVFAIAKAIDVVPDCAQYLGQIPVNGCLIRLYLIDGCYFYVVRKD